MKSAINPLHQWELSDSGFPAIDRLFRISAYDRNHWEAHFISAMAEAYAYHLEHSKEFRGHVELDENAPRVISTMADVERIPWIFVQNFKEAELLSVAKSEISITLTSSGTSGTKTQNHFDAITLNRLRVAGYEVLRALKMVGQTNTPCNYLMFTYDINQAPNLGTAWSDQLISEMSPAAEKVYLIRQSDPANEFEFDLELAIASYERFLKTGLPLRILGFPAFIYHTILEAERRGISRLPLGLVDSSWVITGGGWKNHHGATISKEQFAQFVEDKVGIPCANVRDLFGMTEHGIAYVDCEEGHLHVPVYAHAVTRDPATLSIQAAGVPGILQLFTPLPRSYPSLSLLTSDEVILRDTPCRCGRSGLWLEYSERLGLTQYNGCAIRALEYLNR
jgi:phenylacetate-coenzyme A ligase PaaK-like adenylate-forming protein